MEEDSVSADAIDTVAFIGSTGKMGAMLMERCRRVQVACLPVDAPFDMEKAAGDLAACDMALLCVPAQAVAEVLAALARLLPARTILADVCSVKVRPLDEMLAAHPGPVVATHPLFGPAPAADDPLKVTVCPGRGDQAFERVTAFLARLGFAPFTADAREHDRAMAYVQGLNFVTTVAYLSTQQAHPDFARYLTPSFHRRLAASKKLILEDAGLFRALFEANPYSLEAVRSYRNYLNVAAGGDVELLVERASRWWSTSECERKNP